MNKNNNKILALSVLGMFMFVFAIGLVSAQTALSGPDWLLGIINFLGMGTTWQAVMISIAVFLMIFAATYDILSFTAFETNWVKIVISLSISLVVGVVNGFTVIAGLFAALAGGSVAIGTFIAIVLAVVFFVAGGFLKSKRKNWMAKRKTENSKAGFEKAAAGVRGMGRVADAGAENVDHK